MSLMRWNPMRDLPAFPSNLLSIQKEMNRVFDNVFRGGWGEDSGMVSSAWLPAVDLTERDNELVVKVELPGVAREDVKISLQESILTIRGEKKQERERKDAKEHRVERLYGSFQRSFTLPAPVKGDKVDASYRDGVLTITLPKAEEAKSRQIEVRVT